MKVLWASPNTLLDSSNGAAMMVRECLRQLALRKCDVSILGATVFVSPEGMNEYRRIWDALRQHKGNFLDVTVGELKHRLLVTERSQRRLMLSFEEQRWFDEYRRLLEAEKPDLVLFFDNSLITLLTADEAKRQGVPVAVFLMHGKNQGHHWHRDVNWMFTDTNATAQMYAAREGYVLEPVGTFVEPSKVLAPSHLRKALTFVNPVPAKGAVLIVQMVLALAQRRKDIQIEIVDTRGTWQTMLDQVRTAIGGDDILLNNVTITQNTGDMRSVYARARLLLVPSLWWESGPRVIIEAMMNGVPVIGSDSGGIPEVLGGGGEIFEVPKEYRLAPYMKIFDQSFVDDLIKRVVNYWDDDTFYIEASKRAFGAYTELHDLKRNGDALLKRIQNVIEEFNSKSEA